MYNFHLDDLQGHHRSGMVLGRDIFYELNIDTCFSNSNIKRYMGDYEGCTYPMINV